MVVALIGAAIFIGIRVNSLIKEVKVEERKNTIPKYDETFRSSSGGHSYAVTAKPRETLEPKKEPPTLYEVPMSARATEEQKPTPRASTSEELKQKAISQIMGGK